MTGAYSDSGVDTSASARAIDALIGVLRTIDLGRPSRSRLAAGHYAAVLEIAPNLGLALSTDGVGSKVIVAEQAGRFGTVGIDCIAMNVNDVVCVGAEPIAVLDYLAVERADPDMLPGWRSPAASSRSCPSSSAGTRRRTASTSPAPAWASWASTRWSPERARRPATRCSGCPPAACTPTA